MEIREKVEQALDAIRPTLQSDGGDVELLDVSDDKVYMTFKGACQGCPSSTITLKRGVIGSLRKYAPEIKEVIEVMPDGSSRSHSTAEQPSDGPWAEQHRIDGVKLVIAVASGKGGVGKSTVAVNLALALQNKGLKIGLLDADIYGPNVPTMLRFDREPTEDNGKISPAVAYGLKVISIGFFVPDDSPVVWRGPLIAKTIEQFLHSVNWGELDCLIVDLPPGTGDAQLSLAQKVPIDGAIIVTTPSDVALIDARRGFEMFKKINVHLFGIVENMSYFICPHCGERTDVFSAGGGKKTAEILNTKFLGEIPLDPKIRDGGDHGKPVIVSDVNSPQAENFVRFAEMVWDEIVTTIPSWDKSACQLV